MEEKVADYILLVFTLFNLCCFFLSSLFQFLILLRSATSFVAVATLSLLPSSMRPHFTSSSISLFNENSKYTVNIIIVFLVTISAHFSFLIYFFLCSSADVLPNYSLFVSFSLRLNQWSFCSV